MQTVKGELKKSGILLEDGYKLNIVKIEKMNKPYAVARGIGRKPAGKKSFHFVIKPDGLVLVTM